MQRSRKPLWSFIVLLDFLCGGVAERLNALVSKTSILNGIGGSNPLPSANISKGSSNLPLSAIYGDGSRIDPRVGIFLIPGLSLVLILGLSPFSFFESFTLKAEPTH